MYSFMKLAYAPVRISGDLSKIYDSFLIPAFAPPFSTLLYMPWLSLIPIETLII